MILDHVARWPISVLFVEIEKRKTQRTVTMKLLTILLCLLSATIYAAERPNVVILYADDMGVADVSYGDKTVKIQTPHLDRLAAEGMTFTDGHSSSGICTPSRFAMLTGQHHWRRFHGIAQAFGGPVFEPGDFTIAEMFKKKGYRTAERVDCIAIHEEQLN